MFGKKASSKTLQKRRESRVSLSTSIGKLSSTEQEVIKKVLEILVTQCPEALAAFESIVGSGDHALLCKALINISLTSGTSIDMIKIFLKEEFKRSVLDQASIMRGNCLATKLSKEYLKKIGGEYLRTVMGSFVQDVASLEKSMEIDPLKMEKGDDLEANKQLLLEKCKQLIHHIVSNEMLFKMPPEINYIAELSNTYAPDQFYPLVGGFLLLRYLNPALSNPDVYGLLSENKISSVSRRNFILLTKVLQNLSNGVEFTQKEPYMQCVNDFLKAHFWRLEKYFQSIVTRSPSLPKILDPFATSEEDYTFMHNVLSIRTDKLLQLVEDDATFHTLTEMLEKLNQYRHIDNFLETKYTIDQPVKLRLTIETQEQVYEQTLDASVQFLQPLVENLLAKIRKQEQKEQRNKTSKKKTGNNFFGRPLNEIMEQQLITRPELKIPEVIMNGIAAILLKGLAVPGILKGGNNKQSSTLVKLKKEIEKGERVNLLQEDVIEVGELILCYLRELPDSLFPETLCAHLVAIGAISNNTAACREKMRSFVTSLPKVNRDLCEVIMRLCWNIEANSSVNEMNASALAAAIAPALVRPSKSSKLDINHAMKSIEVMIPNYEYAFKDSLSEMEESIKIPLWKRRIVAHQRSIQCVLLIDETTVCTTAGSCLRMWNTETCTIIKEVDMGSTYGQFLALLAVPEKDEIWCATDRAIQVRELKTCKLKMVLESGASSLLLAGNSVWRNSLEQPCISLYHLDTKKKENSFEIPPENVFILKKIEDDVWGGGVAGTLYIWNTKTFQTTAQIPQAHLRRITTVEIVNDQVWTGSDDGVLCVWTKNNHEFLRKIETHLGKIKTLTFFRDQIWCSTWGLSVRIFSTNFEVMHELKDQHSDAISGVVFPYSQSRQKWFAWTTSFDGTISVWLLPKEPPKKC